MSVIADGVAGPALRELSAEAGTGRTLWFSPDGRHVVHLRAIDGVRHAVVDDRVGPPMQGVDNPAFSPGSVAFIGVIDGKPVRLTARLGE